jgi:hypothetical protein
MVSSGADGGGSTGLIVGVTVTVLAVAAVLVWLLRRRRGGERAEEV